MGIIVYNWCHNPCLGYLFAEVVNIKGSSLKGVLIFILQSCFPASGYLFIQDMAGCLSHKRVTFF